MSASSKGPLAPPEPVAAPGDGAAPSRAPSPLACAAACAFLITLCYYVRALCPSGWWLDSSEFAAASALLGISHPPGHPVAMLWGKLFTLLPVGSLALRVGLGQAVASALGAACITAAGGRLGGRLLATLGPETLGLSPRLSQALCAALALGATLSIFLGYGVAFQAVRPEVYAQHGLLVFAALWHLLAYDETGDRRSLLLGNLLLGLGLVNHHYLMGFSIPPILFLLLRERRERRALVRVVLSCIAVGLFGLILYAYLPLRAARHTLLNWGSPNSLAGFWWVVSAAPFRKSFKPPVGSDADVVGGLIDELHPVAMLLAVVGLYLLIRQRPTRRAGLFLLTSIALSTLGRVGQGFDPANPDVYGYLIPAYVLLALVAGVGAVAGLAAVAHALRPPWALRASLLWVLLWVALGAGKGAAAYPRVNLSRFFDMEELLGEDLRQSPPRAWLFSANFQHVFGLWYLQGALGERPDVMHAHRHFLDNPGYRADLLRRYPDESGLTEALGARDMDLQGALKARPLRPVLYEYDLDTRKDVPPYLAPYGAFESLELQGAQGAPGGVIAARGRAAQRRTDGELRAVGGHVETQRVLLWRSFLGMNLACAKGDGRRLGEELLRSRRLLRGAPSADIDALLKECGPQVGMPGLTLQPSVPAAAPGTPSSTPADPQRPPRPSAPAR